MIMNMGWLLLRKWRIIQYKIFCFFKSSSIRGVKIKNVKDFNQGRIQEFVQGWFNFFSFQGGPAPVGARKPPEINRFCRSWGWGLSPHSPPLIRLCPSCIFDTKQYLYTFFLTISFFLSVVNIRKFLNFSYQKII